MSILNGAYAPEKLYPDANPFGEPFRQINQISLAGAIDIEFYKGHIVAAGRGKLAIYDIKNGNAELVGELGGLGDSRQLVIYDGFAYLTARADGLYIIDLREGSPLLAAHIDTLELATGVACVDGILAVTNRHMGCELFDVQDPYHPKRMGDFVCGEAQSVWLYENLALVSDWMNKRIHIFDITNPWEAKKISEFGMDGFADGVCVFKTEPDLLHPSGRVICVAASGHHSAKLKNRRKYNEYSFVTAEMLAEGYGCGHGVEFFDITDPYAPEYVSSLKAPPHFGGIDTWRVSVVDGCCYFVDSIGGMFEIDISDIENPKFTRYFRLPPKENQNQIPPSIQPFRGAVTGVALTEKYVCAAGDDGVHILERRNADVTPKGVTQITSAKVDKTLPAPEYHNPEVKTIFSLGQLHSFVSFGGTLLCAAGDRGIVEFNSGKSLTDTMCCDITIFNDVVISAESDAGVAAYRYENGGLNLIDRMTFGDANPVREVVKVDEYLLLQNALVRVQTVMFDGHFKECGEPQYVGILYHRHIARSDAGKCPIVLPLNLGAELLMPSDNGFVRSEYRLGFEMCPIEEGACGLGDGMILIFNKRYYYLPNAKEISKLPAPIECVGAMLNGIPFVCGKRLVLLNRVTGRVEILDISNPLQPKFDRRIETELHPEFADEVDGRLLIACGFGGIIDI